MLKENIPFYKPCLLLLIVVVCILAFIYVAQRIFFAGSDKKHIPFCKIFLIPILFTLGTSIIITLIYHLLDSYTFYEILNFFNFH